MNIKPLTYIFYIAVVLALVSCAVKTSSNVISISPHITYTITAPPDALVSTTHTHLIEASFDGKQQRFIAQIEFKSQQISLAGMSVTGVPLFDFTWQNGQVVDSNQYVPLPGLDLHYLIADMQWIIWPIESLIASTDGEHISVTQSNLASTQEDGLDNDWIRMVKYKNKNVLNIRKMANQYTLQHTLRNYEIKITDVSKDKL